MNKAGSTCQPSRDRSLREIVFTIDTVEVKGGVIIARAVA
jgi:hypothetical protein